MKRIFVLVMVLMLSLSIPMAPTVEADNPVDWEIEIDPSFGFITENVTVKTYGEAGVYFVIRIYDPNNQTVSDAFIPVEDGGVSTYNYKIPVDATPGFYLAEASFEGEVVAIKCFEVIYDEVLYWKAKLGIMDENIDEIEALMIYYRNTMIKELNEKEQIKNLSFFGFSIAVICMIVVFWKFRQLLAWKMSFYNEETKRNKWKLLLSPQQRGYMGTLCTEVDGNLAQYQKTRRKEFGLEESATYQPYLVFRSKDGEDIRKEIQLVNPRELKFGTEIAEDIDEKVERQGPYARLGHWCQNVKSRREARNAKKKTQKTGDNGK